MDRYGLICRSIWETPGITQRELARLLDVSWNGKPLGQ